MFDYSKRIAVVSIMQLVVGLAASASAFCVGTAIGYTSPALPSMTDRNVTNFEVTSHQASWVGGIMPLAGLLGGLLGCPLMIFLGRRKAVLLSAIPFLLSWLLIGFATSVIMVLCGRFLSGIAMGIISNTLPVYVGEVFHPLIRGTFSVMMTMFCNIGLVICYAIGIFAGWSDLAFTCAGLCLPYLLLMLIVPESPRWLASKGKVVEAEAALKRLRRKTANTAEELKEIIKPLAEATENTNICSELFQRKNLRALSIALGLFFFQQACGISAILFYTVMIFNLSGSSVDSYVSTLIIGLVNLFGTLVATIVIDFTGRKLLLYISSVAMTIMLSVLTVFFYCRAHNLEVLNYDWLPLTSFMIYVLGLSLGFGPVPWVMLGEVLPSRIRGPGAAIVVSFNWTCSFVVTKTFQDIIDTIGLHGAMALFCFGSIFAFIFTIVLVPETKNKTLEEIEVELTGEPVR